MGNRAAQYLGLVQAPITLKASIDWIMMQVRTFWPSANKFLLPATADNCLDCKSNERGRCWEVFEL